MIDEIPDGWVRNTRMAWGRGYLNAFRTKDHGEFVDIVEYQPHMDAEYRVEYRTAVGDEPRTVCEESVDCDGEGEAWDVAVQFMEGDSP